MLGYCVYVYLYVLLGQQFVYGVEYMFIVCIEGNGEVGWVYVVDYIVQFRIVELYWCCCVCFLVICFVDFVGSVEIGVIIILV